MSHNHQIYLVNYALYGTTAAYPSKGVLTVNIDGTWGTVCSDGFEIKDADAACRGLGYRHAIYTSNVGFFDACRKSCERQDFTK